MHIGDRFNGVADPALSERLVRQTEAAGARHRAAEAQREEIARRRAAGMRFPDEPERLARRARRLVEAGAVPGEALLAIPPDAERLRTDERIIGDSNDLQSSAFLPRGVRAAATVGRIWSTAGGVTQPMATGFLVSPRLLLTNHHVFPDAAAPDDAFVEFGADVGMDGMPAPTVRFTFAPAVFFAADENLDYALVAVAPGLDGRRAGDTFGWNRLDGSEGKLVIGDSVNIVGHPSGRLKEICIRGNELLVRLDEFIHYTTDTEPGNSGSPVFNDQWEVVALHHRGVPKTDDKGQTLNVDGGVWTADQGDGAVAWIANEGARISVVMRHLAATVAPASREALTELGAAAMPAAESLPGAAAAVTVPGPRTAESVPVLTGVTGRSEAFGTTRQLVFLHGRSQEGHAPEDLRRSWVNGLNAGFARLGFPPIDAADVFFPYYGDRLAGALRPQEALPTSFDAVARDPEAAAAPVSASARSLYQRLLRQAAAEAGMPEGDDVAADEGFGLGNVVKLTRKPLDWLARHSGMDRLVIAAAFRDVALYLDDGRVRDQVLGCVRETVPSSGGIVLVAHSLGTVVAMDLLAGGVGPDVTALVTVGAPLGMDTVYDRLLTHGPHCPARVAMWFNGWAPADGVAIGCPLRGTWSGLTGESSVDNPRDRAHDIDEYLSNPAVAGVIGTQLGLVRR
ncbi:trypsin-like serine peptidase [Yinghuangia seranimata]|uniref:trypsin-like serine peptidase n=1 Tax=Yinghuangia seranimata TaxID=408067 RepID=UPI00248BD030|nr:serine protease [Yinghuangia seranimata]MDI2132079.1 serine protease [Yinghuangia seranimata]